MLSITPFEEHMQELVSALDVKGGSDACEGIMTTDTFKKQLQDFTPRAGYVISAVWLARSGMIHPNMATMLAFLTNDVAISAELLDAVVHEVVAHLQYGQCRWRYPSTNDMLSILANGLGKESGNLGA